MIMSLGSRGRPSRCDEQSFADEEGERDEEQWLRDRPTGRGAVRKARQLDAVAGGEYLPGANLSREVGAAQPLEDRFAGRRAKCPNCSAPISAPSGSAFATPPSTSSISLTPDLTTARSGPAPTVPSVELMPIQEQFQPCPGCARMVPRSAVNCPKCGCAARGECKPRSTAVCDKPCDDRSKIQAGRAQVGRSNRA